MEYHANSADGDLIRGCMADNRLAQKYMYERYAGKLMGICMRYAEDREEALEMLNSAFLKIFQNLGNYQPIAPLSGWMAKIVFRTAIDFVRSKKTYRHTIKFPEVLNDQTPGGSILPDLEAQDIYRLIQSLPAMNRNVFSMFVIDGYKHKDIAETFGFDEATSRWYLAQARKILQQKLVGDPRLKT
jgi:RNA polymerase sigma-70 factor (ECF subfamily)